MIPIVLIICRWMSVPCLCACVCVFCCTTPWMILNLSSLIPFCISYNECYTLPTLTTVVFACLSFEYEYYSYILSDSTGRRLSVCVCVSVCLCSSRILPSPSSSTFPLVSCSTWKFHSLFLYIKYFRGKVEKTSIFECDTIRARLVLLKSPVKNIHHNYRLAL